MTNRLMIAVATALLVATPVAGQTATVANSGPQMAEALKQPKPRTWAQWWTLFNEMIARVSKSVGDLVEPELGSDYSKVPPSIASNFDTSALITTGLPFARSAKPDVVGAFRFICTAGQIAYNDPIVYPGQPGKSHLHQFFGNTGANAFSTYASLRTSGDSTCMNMLNRSAYWIPAMLDGKGHVVRPDYVSIYYKNRPTTDPECKKMARFGCVALPRGLRMIFGYDMITGKTPTGSFYFNCDGPTAKPGHYPTLGEAASNCPSGNRIGAIIEAPNCWDNKRLDSPNHRDHVGYGDRTNGYKCDDDHPASIPGYTLAAWYTVDDARANSWYFSSDEMLGMKRMIAGTSFHADWFGAWDDETMATWMNNCIDKLLNCSGGDLGNGTMLKEQPGFSWNANLRLVSIPPR